MVVRLLDEAVWDGRALLVVAMTDGGQVTCRVPRQAIHALRSYSDIIGREIWLERRKIVERLAPFLICEAFAGWCRRKTVELLPSEVHD